MSINTDSGFLKRQWSRGLSLIPCLLVPGWYLHTFKPQNKPFQLKRDWTWLHSNQTILRLYGSITKNIALACTRSYQSVIALVWVLSACADDVSLNIPLPLFIFHLPFPFIISVFTLKLLWPPFGSPSLSCHNMSVPPKAWTLISNLLHNNGISKSCLVECQHSVQTIAQGQNNRDCKRDIHYKRTLPKRHVKVVPVWLCLSNTDQSLSFKVYNRRMQVLVDTSTYQSW